MKPKVRKVGDIYYTVDGYNPLAALMSGANKMVKQRLDELGIDYHMFAELMGVHKVRFVTWLESNSELYGEKHSHGMLINLGVYVKATFVVDPNYTVPLELQREYKRPVEKKKEPAPLKSLLGVTKGNTCIYNTRIVDPVHRVMRDDPILCTVTWVGKTKVLIKTLDEKGQYKKWVHPSRLTVISN